MSLLPTNGKIVVYNQPMNARYGLPRMMSFLTANSRLLGWNGFDPITVITFNAKLTICKILIVDEFGATCANRIRITGRFKHILAEGLIPLTIHREKLEQLLHTGSIGMTRL